MMPTRPFAGLQPLGHPEELSRRIQPLANPVRLRLLDFLRSPRYLEEMASHLRMSHQAARKHVNLLAAAGLVTRSLREDAAVVEYAVNSSALLRLHAELEALCTRFADGRDGTGPEAPDGPCLTIVRGHPVGTRHALAEGRTVLIGRGAGSNVNVEHDLLACHRHAEIRFEEGRWRTADLASAHGTWHNWTRLPQGGQAVLRHGDIVGVGRTLLLFWDPKATPTQPGGCGGNRLVHGSS